MINMDKRLEQAINDELQDAKFDYYKARKDYGIDSIEVRTPVIKAIYFMECWIMFANGCTDCWFTPFDFFAGESGSLESQKERRNNFNRWCDLHQEAIRNKTVKWN